MGGRQLGRDEGQSLSVRRKVRLVQEERLSCCGCWDRACENARVANRALVEVEAAEQVLCTREERLTEMLEALFADEPLIAYP